MHLLSNTSCHILRCHLHGRDCRRFAALFLVIVFTVLSLSIPASGTESSPYRAFYPHIKTLSTVELYQDFFTKTLIDVRSRVEFNVVHIAASVNLPLAEDDFADRLFKLKALQEEIELVLVGNDPDCSRAFDAARVARLQGMSNVSVYDAGVFAWLHAYPEKTRLMGETPAQLERVLPLVQHQIHLASHDRFKRLAREPGALVVDIRDIYRRRDVIKGLPVKNIVLGALLQAVGNRVWSERPLLIFDSDGSKTRWLQIFLQAGGYHNYHFLEGGLDALPPENLSPISGRANDTVSVNQKYLKNALADLKGNQIAADFFGYIISSVRLKNLAFISSEEASVQLLITPDQLLYASEQLAETGLIRFFEAGGNLIYQIDPLIVWKGEMVGERWRESVGQFHNHHPE
jgi:rhodanese-related sulfurtransferase